jgi:beta-ketoacyl ACP synthase
VTRPSTANGGFPNVVVTAVTATTAIAPDIESTWKGLLAGESGIRILEDEFVDKWDLQVKIGGHLKEPLDPLRRKPVEGSQLVAISVETYSRGSNGGAA